MKRLAILATGGTIAGVGTIGKDFGYKSGSLSITELMSSVEGKLSADIFTEQICNVNSDDITSEIWLILSNRINKLMEDKTVDAVVITHGTDTMDETAFFLALTVKAIKPVVITGSMRPSTAKEPDGPFNLYHAILAATKIQKGGVYVQFGLDLYDALHVQKCSASALLPMGCNFPQDLIFKDSLKLPFFDVSLLSTLLKVNVVYFAVDADASILKYASQVSDGLVLAGAGSGEFSTSFSKTLSTIDIPVVVSTRINHGFVSLNEELAPGCIPAGYLPPQKAAILLRLSLSLKKNIKEMFLAVNAAW